MKITTNHIKKLSRIVAAILVLGMLKEDASLMLRGGFLDNLMFLFLNILTIGYGLFPLWIIVFGINELKSDKLLWGAGISVLGILLVGTFYIFKYLSFNGPTGTTLSLGLMPLYLTTPMIVGFPLGWMIDKLIKRSNHGLESTGTPPAAGTPETHP